MASHGEATTSRDHNISRNPHRDGEGHGWLGVRQWRYSSVAIIGSTTKPAGIIISPLYFADGICFWAGFAPRQSAHHGELMIVKAPDVLVELARTLFTKRNRILIWSSLFLVLAIDLMAESLHEIFNWVIEHNYCVRFPWHELWYLAIFPVVFLFARRQYRRLSAASSLRIDARSSYCEGLVLFVSKAPDEVEARDIEKLHEGATSNGKPLLDASWRADFKSHLRMPLEALAFHYSGEAGRTSPKRVTLLSSRQSFPLSQTVREAFEALIGHIVEGVKVVTIESVHPNEKWTTGVDYGKPQEVVDLIEAVYADHETHGISSGDVILDVTGGMGLGSVLGSMTALKAGRRVEFTTSDLARITYSVKVFDFEYTEPVDKE